MSYQNPPSHYPAKPPLSPSDERTWSILLHLSPLVGLGLWAPLVVWLVFRGRGPFLEHHAKQALNFHITLFLAAIVAVLAAVVTMGIAVPLVFVVVIWEIVLAIIAAVATNRGEWYRYPANITFFS
ncbi:MAG: DUF4870 domain-containing protein [Actinomycetales bacterium]|nr:DUF4870 domain-containing protein [Actinomycetales bacterium]